MAWIYSCFYPPNSYLTVLIKIVKSFIWLARTMVQLPCMSGTCTVFPPCAARVQWFSSGVFALFHASYPRRQNRYSQLTRQKDIFGVFALFHASYSMRQRKILSAHTPERYLYLPKFFLSAICPERKALLVRQELCLVLLWEECLVLRVVFYYLPVPLQSTQGHQYIIDVLVY